MVDIRHAWLKSVLVATLLLGVTKTEVVAQKEFDGLRGTHKWMRFTDAPNALYHHLATEAIQRLEQRAETISALETLESWKERQSRIRATLIGIAGPFPEKTPLNARVTQVINKEGFSVENILYESQPGFYVTASLFIPSGRNRKKAPAVIYCSGHTELGYRADGYQNVILNLVMKGFVVFAIDPIGQGERLQYYNEQTGESNFEWPSYEHSYAGAQLFITGNSLGRHMTWDGIRAVDYLVTRREVDADRIGMTGGSGGGTQSALIAAFDERVKVVVPGNYFTNFSWLLQSMGPQCAEQEFFSAISRGLDMADLLLVRAPLPALMVTTSRDMFPIQGAIETAAEVSRLYKAYGRADNFRMAMDDAAHASTAKNRESLYAFFQKHLDNPGDSTEIVIKPLTRDELQVTETGQVSTSLNAETVFSLNLKTVETKNKQLNETRKSAPDYLSEIAQVAKELSGYREPGATPKPVFTGRIQRDGYTVLKYFVQGEGDYVIPYLLMEPENPGTKALIYLHPEGKVPDSDEGEDMEWFVRHGFTVLAPDIIGTGEMGPGAFKGDSYIDSVSYNVWFTSLLIGRSITGVRAGDVVRLANLLKAQYSIKEIYGLAKKEMAPVLLHAAAFDEDISRVALINPYSSYRSLVTSRYYNPEFIHGAVQGSIGVYDLPDLAATIAPGKLLIVEATDGTGKNTDKKIIEEDISVIESGYAKANASSQLHIVGKTSGKKLFDIYKEWITE